MRRAAMVMAAVLAGCGSGSSGSLSIDDFGVKAATWVCGIISKCAFPLASYATQACIQSSNPAADIKVALNANRVKYDGAQAQACVDALNALSCSALSGTLKTPASCQAALKGTVAAGGACTTTRLDFDCASGYCKAPSGSCSGTCAALAQLGADCTSTRCDAGLVCGTNNRCSTPLAPGGAGATCTSGSDCAFGFYCLSGVSTGTCTAQVQAGGTCGEDSAHAFSGLNGQCAVGLVCRGLVVDIATGSTTPGVCTFPVDEGALCVSSSTGKYTVTGCKYGLVCPSGSCVKPPSSGTCANDLFTPCLLTGAGFGTGGYYCDSTSTCKAPKAAGAACASSQECADGNCSNMVCVAVCHEA
jgi:hypothetical protein